MRIAFNETVTLSSMEIHVCLRAVLDFARQQNQFSFVQDVFRYSHGGKGHVSFGICGGLFEENLTWADVAVIVKELQTFYSDPKHCRQSTLYLRDRERDVLGSADLSIEQNETSNSEENR